MASLRFLSAPLGALSRDVRVALRMLWRTRAVTFAAVLALGLGIGANTAIFSVVDGVLLRPLPFPDSQSLYQLNTGAGKNNRFDDPLSYPQYRDVEAGARSFESVGAWVDGDGNLTGGAGGAERVLVRGALPSLLPTLRVQPQRGRNFLPEETTEGRDRVVLISHELWQRQFAGDEAALGRRITLDGADRQIIGVLPRGFSLGGPVDLWVPLTTTGPSIQVRNAHFLEVIGRIRPGATDASIAAELQAIADRQSRSFPDMFPERLGFGFRARPYLEAMVGEVRLPLLVLLAAVAFVLIITCANVANLLLARAAARAREMAIRTALGAGRARLVRQLLTESLLLSLAGGGLGVLLAALGIDALLALSPDSLPRVAEVSLDLRVLLFTGLTAIGTGIAFGLVPAITESRPDLHDTLKDGTFGSTVGRGRLRSALVVAEVAICLVLLVGAGLMLRSFQRLRDVPPGFRPDHALTFRVSLPDADGPRTDADRARFRSFYSRAVDRLRLLPGVTAVGAGNIVPLDGRSTGRLIDIQGYVKRDSGDLTSAQNRQGTAGWFAALGIPLIAGRGIQDSDGADAPAVVVVNQAFVRRYFPDGKALGKRMRLGKLTEDFPWATIVGVVGDVRGRALHIAPRPEMYWPVAQFGGPSLAVVVRTYGDPAALASSVRAAMAEVDRHQPIFGLQTLEHLVASSLGERRFTLTLMLVFGFLALALAAVGIYGVMAYAVAQRTREIGIRVALGARPAAVLSMVVRSGMLLVGLGTAIGTLIAVLVTRLAESLLYEISSTDAPTYLAIAAALAVVALVATLLPARHAMKVDPMRALRAE